MYERLTKLLEAELLRMNGDEQNALLDEHKDIIASSPIPTTRPDTRISEKISSDQSSQSNNRHPGEEFDGKSSSTRPGRSTIAYDESGNQWDSNELERKQKNPYRWFIEKQREKQKAKGPTQDEEATSAMVNLIYRKMIRDSFVCRKLVFEVLLNNFVIGYMN
jgi:DNA mismatch repair ATPase MutL